MVRNIAAYRFVLIADPAALAARLQASAQAHGLRGSVLVAPEGLNLFLAGDAAGVDGFVAALREDPRFADLAVKVSESTHVPFARLKVKVKPEIIAFRRNDASPLGARAPSVSPADLARWIAQGRDDHGRRLVLLDTRNREETAHGAFAGALVLPIDNFTDLPDALVAHRAQLRDATVVSYCTGGIRCEKAALWMRAQGLDNVLQLDGGILGYFEQVGGQGYEGSCFVFDERVALDAALRPLVDAPVETKMQRPDNPSSSQRTAAKTPSCQRKLAPMLISSADDEDRSAPEHTHQIVGSGLGPEPGRRSGRTTSAATSRLPAPSPQPSRRAQP